MREKKKKLFLVFAFYRECVNLNYLYWAKTLTFSLQILDYSLIYAY